eukprot:1160657-Pelagomonas_calceolata.AAC.3
MEITCSHCLYHPLSACLCVWQSCAETFSNQRLSHTFCRGLVSLLCTVPILAHAPKQTDVEHSGAFVCLRSKPRTCCGVAISGCHMPSLKAPHASSDRPPSFALAPANHVQGLVHSVAILLWLLPIMCRDWYVRWQFCFGSCQSCAGTGTFGGKAPPRAAAAAAAAATAAHLGAVPPPPLTSLRVGAHEDRRRGGSGSPRTDPGALTTSGKPLGNTHLVQALVLHHLHPTNMAAAAAAAAGHTLPLCAATCLTWWVPY